MTNNNINKWEYIIKNDLDGTSILDIVVGSKPSIIYFGHLTTTFNTIPWTEFLALSYLIFMIGLIGIIFNFKNFLVTMFSVELMYLGITISFILVSVVTHDPKGQIYAMILLILAAAESAIGLGILIVLFRFGKSIDFESYQELKG
jgi:NADH-quinone oxidoreductase subunit K